jgi:glycosyltransferase involved in cell wall biosynthesis
VNILIISQYYFPEQFRINDICEELVNKGHAVTVLTGLPNYSDGKVPNEYKWFKKRKETINGVKVIRCWEIGRRKNSLSLALSYMSYMISASLRAVFLFERYDIVFGYQMSPITQILPGMVYKWLRKKPLLIYCCDLWPESVKSLFKNENGTIYKIANYISNKVYKSGDLVAISSLPFKEYLFQIHGIDSNKMPYLPQHAEDTYLEVDFTPEDNECIDFLFAGNVGIAQDMDCIINACDINRNLKGYKVHIVGDGSYLQRTKQLVMEKNLVDIFVFHGRHPLDSMPKFYKLADACLLTLKADNMTGLTMPSKLQGYLAAGKPVIGAINGAATDVINSSNCGVCVNASDSIALAKVMENFVKNPTLYKNCGENGREYFRNHFTKQKFTKNLEKILNGLLEG